MRYSRGTRRITSQMTFSAPRTLHTLILIGATLWAMRAVWPAEAPPAASATIAWPPPDTLVSWQQPRTSNAHLKTLRLLAFNDFHGNLLPPTMPQQRQAGGAAVLASYLEAAEREAPDDTLIVHAGDLLGAAPPITRLLQNEPAIAFLNLLANDHCVYGNAEHFFDVKSAKTNPDRCNVIGTLGNHEFDAGPEEIHRLLQGGNAPTGPFLESPFRGSRVPYVCANVRDRRSGKLLLPPYAVVELGGERIGLIGAVLRDTPAIVPAWAMKNLEFLDEATAINQAAAQLERAGIHTIIVTIHQGLTPLPHGDEFDYGGPLRDIVAQLDPDIDVVISGHTHQFTNTLLPNRAGSPVLVTQAYAYGIAYADIRLEVDMHTHDVVAKSARMVATWDDAGPGLAPDARVAALAHDAAQSVAPRVAQVLATFAAPVTRAPSAAGESALGNLVADAQRDATHADIALMNPGGLRTDLNAGTITWGDVLTLHPFGNRLVTMSMTGAQLRTVLEQQWPSGPKALARVLKTSGFYYVWDPARPPGNRVVRICDGAHRPLVDAGHYRVTVSDYLAGGGDNFSSLTQIPANEIGPLDSEALRAFLLAHPDVTPRIEGRITLADALSQDGCPP